MQNVDKTTTSLGVNNADFINELAGWGVTQGGSAGNWGYEFFGSANFFAGAIDYGLIGTSTPEIHGGFTCTIIYIN